MFLSEPFPMISPVSLTNRLQRVHPVINNEISSEFLATDEDKVDPFSLLIDTDTFECFCAGRSQGIPLRADTH